MLEHDKVLTKAQKVLRSHAWTPMQEPTTGGRQWRAVQVQTTWSHALGTRGAAQQVAFHGHVCRVPLDTLRAL